MRNLGHNKYELYSVENFRSENSSDLLYLHAEPEPTRDSWRLYVEYISKTDSVIERKLVSY